MVYCGKASQGCQSCRKRRIKCDKLQPNCSQCVRINKKCPGYRDQLSLMFRDESDKVMQKAHAQWGMGDEPSSAVIAGPSSSKSPSSSSSSSSPSSVSVTGHPATSPDASQPLPSSPASNTNSALTRTTTARTPTRHPVSSQPWALSHPVNPTLEEQGFQFYVNRYLVGHPDEPRNSEELKVYQWLWSPALRDVSAAMGLASLSNLRNDNELMVDARRRYGMALRTAGELIQSDGAVDVDLTSRLVVMLAMFELVKGTELSTGSVYAHVAGGAALIRSWYPMRDVPCGGVRPLLQLCYSTFLTAYEVGIPLPAGFNDWIAFAQHVASPRDVPAITLGLLIARFIGLSAKVRYSVLRDGKSTTTSTIQHLLNLDTEFEEWEESLDDYWEYKVEHGSHLPPAAVFQGEYHVYVDMWVARIWNYYRWARVLIGQLVLDLAAKNPTSSHSLITLAASRDRLENVQSLARDTLASIPSHWRHPLLGDKTPLPVQQQGGAGAGAAGVPVLLFHLKTAACAPKVPREYWSWAYNVIECIWGDMGMHHARFMMDSMVAHREEVDRPGKKPKQKFILGLEYETDDISA